jgi:ornithine cyclodeaminase/alanine dehydrogenase-like protein (mu-crystallin family)
MAQAPIYISGSEAERLLDQASVLRVIENALKELSDKRIVNGSKGGFSLNDQDGQRHMGAISGCDITAAVAGVKWFAACDGNSRRGLPRVPATILLCDAVTGLLTGVIDATSLTAIRTAALAVTAIRSCISRPLKKATIVGFGPIGQTIAQYMPRQIDVAEIVIASTRAVADEFVRSTAAEGSPRFTVEGRLDQAVRHADLVVTATGLSADTPLVDADWLQHGATVCALGSYQEIDSRIISGADRIYIDNWEAGRQRGNLAPMIRSGALTREEIDGEVADVVAGKIVGRTSGDQAVLIVLVGIGALDIALGAELLKQARLRGGGRPLD